MTLQLDCMDNIKDKKMNENEIMNFTIDDFRDLTPGDTQQDNFRRMFQVLGLIYRNQLEIKDMLVLKKDQ